MNGILKARQTLVFAIAFGLPAAQAATVTIDPDDYTGDVSNVALGATLSTFRWNGTTDYQFDPVSTVAAGAWAPTGSRVFGHAKAGPGESSHQWDYLSGAYHCEHNAICNANFYAFRVDFDMPASSVSVLSTLRGEQATDPVELSAFNAAGQRLLRCSGGGINAAVLASGVLPNPRYLTTTGEPGSAAACGIVIEKKNCAGSAPGNCDYVISLRVQRRQADIAYVMFAGPFYKNTWAPVDQLSYIYFPAPH